MGCTLSTATDLLCINLTCAQKETTGEHCERGNKEFSAMGKPAA